MFYWPVSLVMGKGARNFLSKWGPKRWGFFAPSWWLPEIPGSTKSSWGEGSLSVYPMIFQAFIHPVVFHQISEPSTVPETQHLNFKLPCCDPSEVPWEFNAWSRVSTINWPFATKELDGQKRQARNDARVHLEDGLPVNGSVLNNYGDRYCSHRVVGPPSKQMAFFHMAFFNGGAHPNHWTIHWDANWDDP